MNYNTRYGNKESLSKEYLVLNHSKCGWFDFNLRFTCDHVDSVRNSLCWSQQACFTWYCLRYCSCSHSFCFNQSPKHRGSKQVVSMPTGPWVSYCDTGEAVMNETMTWVRACVHVCVCVGGLMGWKQGRLQVTGDMMQDLSQDATRRINYYLHNWSKPLEKKILPVHALNVGSWTCDRVVRG